MVGKAAQKLIQHLKIVRAHYLKVAAKCLEDGTKVRVSRCIGASETIIPCHEILRLRSVPRLTTQATRQPLSFSNTMFGRYTNLTRQIQTQSGCMEGTEVPEKAEVRDSKAGSLSDLKAEAMQASSEFSAESSEMSKLKSSSKHDLAMVFTCNVCETRSVKTCCRDSYENGVVIVRCGGCNNLHLMADRLGWFGEPGSVEDLLAARGDEFKKGAIDSLNLTLEDLAGKKL